MRRLPQFLAAAAFAIGFAGCGPGTAKVTGKITCNGIPVKGSVQISPFGEGSDNTGPAVSAPLKEDGSFALEIKTTGKHRIQVSPSDVKYPAKPGEEYPCDLSPIEKELKPGQNDLVLELPPPKK